MNYAMFLMQFFKRDRKDGVLVNENGGGEIGA